MVAINQYETCGKRIGDFVSNGFSNMNGYVSRTTYLYETSIILILCIGDDMIMPNVRCDDGDYYTPFYNPDLRHHNLVFDEVAKNYNKFMDSLVDKGLLRRKEDNMNGNVKVKKLNDLAKIPARGSAYAAGYDLFAAINESIAIKPGETKKIGTGLSMELPDGYFGAIFARSGLATKNGIRPSNCVGVCDSDYRGEYIVALHNDSDKTYVVEPGTKIAQLILMPYEKINFEVVDELSDTSRGSGGFGSTGK